MSYFLQYHPCLTQKCVVLLVCLYLYGYILFSQQLWLDGSMLSPQLTLACTRVEQWVKGQGQLVCLYLYGDILKFLNVFSNCITYALKYIRYVVL